MAKPKIKSTFRLRTVPPNFFSVFEKAARLKATEFTRDVAKEVAAEAKDVIRKQKYNWAPLSPGYKEAKKRKGLDARILVATKDFVNNGIGYWEKDKFSFVGPRRGIHKPSGIPYRTIGRWFEFGTWKMPARPLWRPLLSKALLKHKLLRKKYNKSLTKTYAQMASTAVKSRKV